MISILKERQLTEYQKEMLELEEEVPQKFNKDDIEFNAKISTKHKARYMDTSSPEYRRWVEKMVCEHFNYKNGKVSTEHKIVDYNLNTNYKTYTREEVARLMKDYLEYKDSK